MSYIERTLTVGDYTIEIRSDDDAESPDTCGNTDVFLAYNAYRVGAGRKRGAAGAGRARLPDGHYEEAVGRRLPRRAAAGCHAKHVRAG